jgi:hypothetical protein
LLPIFSNFIDYNSLSNTFTRINADVKGHQSLLVSLECEVSCFSQGKTSETKIGFLLIDIFKKLFNPQDDGHLATGGHLLFISLFARI